MHSRFWVTLCLFRGLQGLSTSQVHGTNILLSHMFTLACTHKYILPPPSPPHPNFFPIYPPPPSPRYTHTLTHIHTHTCTHTRTHIHIYTRNTHNTLICRSECIPSPRASCQISTTQWSCNGSAVPLRISATSCTRRSSSNLSECAQVCALEASCTKRS